MTISRMKELYYKIKFRLHVGQKAYCIVCIPLYDEYPYWLINTYRATLKPKGQCNHK